MSDIPRFYVVPDVPGYIDDDLVWIMLDRETGEGYPFGSPDGARRASVECNMFDDPGPYVSDREAGDAALDKLADYAKADPLAMDPDERAATQPARYLAARVLGHWRRTFGPRARP